VRACSRSFAVGGVTRPERREFKFRRRNLEGAEGPLSGRAAFGETASDGQRPPFRARGGIRPPEPVSRPDPPLS